LASASAARSPGEAEDGHHERQRLAASGPWIWADRRDGPRRVILALPLVTTCALRAEGAA
jgi:hypothetical protein